MKVSVVIAILDSHEIVRRQILHFTKMSLPDDIEFIFVDDGSTPQLRGEMRNLTILYTNDKRSWTQGLARNLGAFHAKGEYMLFTDIDLIITKEALAASREFTGDKMVFPRYYGILNEQGDIVCNRDSMLAFGLEPRRVKTRRGYMCAGVHSNTYLIRKSIFEQIGGYDKHFCEMGFHMGGRFGSEESRFNSMYNRLLWKDMALPQVVGPKLYFFPVGKYRTDGNNNPFGLFHGLSLEQVPQPTKEK